VEGSGPHVPPGARLAQLIDDPALASWAPVGISVYTNLKPGIRELLAGPQPRSRPAPDRLVRPAALPKTHLTDKLLMQQIAALRSNDSIIVEEAPSSRAAMHDYLPILTRDTFYTCSSGGLGHALPAAIGVALGTPGKKVIALLGDGSSLYAIQGLWTAAQLRLPIAFIIVNNRRYEALIQFGQHFGLDRHIGTELPNIDFCAIARGQGCQAIRVDRPEDLDDALRAAFAALQPTLVDVIVE